MATITSTSNFHLPPLPYPMSGIGSSSSGGLGNSVSTNCGSTARQGAAAPANKIKAVFCQECKVTLNSEEQAKAHYGGKSHQNRVKELASGAAPSPSTATPPGKKVSVVCTECNVTLNSEEQAKSHYGGKHHQNRLKELGINVSSDSLSSATVLAPGSKAASCPACNLVLNSEAQAQQHYKGRSHMLRLQELGLAQGIEAPPALVPNAPKPPIAAVVSTHDVNLPTQTQQHFEGMTAHPMNCQEFMNYSTAAIPNQGMNYDTLGDGGAGHETWPVAGGVPSHPPPAELAIPCIKRKATTVVCDACGLTMNSDTQAAAHFASRRHIKRTKLENDSQKQWNSVLSGDTPELTPRRNRFFCQQCRISVNSMSQLTAHMQGQNHHNKLQRGQHPYAISTVGQPGELRGMPANSWTEVMGNKNGWFYCRLCNISVPTSRALSQHIQSDAHLQQKYQRANVVVESTYNNHGYIHETAQLNEQYCYDTGFDPNNTGYVQF